jgi:hypothetical protein
MEVLFDLCEKGELHECFDEYVLNKVKSFYYSRLPYLIDIQKFGRIDMVLRIPIHDDYFRMVEVLLRLLNHRRDLFELVKRAEDVYKEYNIPIWKTKKWIATDYYIKNYQIKEEKETKLNKQILTNLFNNPQKESRFQKKHKQEWSYRRNK